MTEVPATRGAVLIRLMVITAAIYPVFLGTQREDTPQQELLPCKTGLVLLSHWLT